MTGVIVSGRILNKAKGGELGIYRAAAIVVLTPSIAPAWCTSVTTRIDKIIAEQACFADAMCTFPDRLPATQAAGHPLATFG